MAHSLFCRRRYMPLLLLPAFISYSSVAQESRLISFPMYDPRDSAALFTLVQEGVAVLDRDADSAMSLFKAAEIFSRHAGMNDGTGYALAFEGLTATTQGNYALGFAYYQEALPYCLTASKFKFVLAYLYSNMAISWKQQGNYEKANEYYHKSLTCFQKYLPKNKYLIAVYINLIGIQARMGSFDRALAYAGQAEQWARSQGDQKLEALAILNKGDVYYTMKLPDSALRCYRRGFRIVDTLKNEQLRRSYFLSMGNVMLQENKYQEAVRYFQKVIQSGNEGSRPLSGFILPRYSLGAALFGLKRYNEAERVLLIAIAEAKRTGLTENELNGHGILSGIYEATGRYKEALAQQEIYLALKDSLTTLEKIRAINSIDAKYQVAQKDKAIYKQQLQISVQQKKITTKNLIIAGSGGGMLLLIIAGLAVYGHKRKMNERDAEIKQLRAMMAGEEKERTRISRELHDGLGGMLTGIKLNLRALQKQNDTAGFPQSLDSIMSMLQRLGEEIHKTAHNLMPDILLKHDLAEALKTYCGQLNKGQLQLSLQFHGDLQVLEQSMKLSLYRIMQELVQNMIRHAHATEGAIQIRRSGEVLYISVEDNGVGFERKSDEGLGLRNLEARVRSLNGYTALSSVPGKGTTIFIEINLKNKLKNE